MPWVGAVALAGVVSPVVNIAAKVESFKARDSRSMMKSTDYKDSQQKVQKKAADAGDEVRARRCRVCCWPRSACRGCQ